MQGKKKKDRAAAEAKKAALKAKGIDVEGANLLDDARDEDLLFEDWK